MAASPLNETPSIVLAVANLVAVAALPVISSGISTATSSEPSYTADTAPVNLNTLGLGNVSFAVTKSV